MATPHVEVTAGGPSIHLDIKESYAVEAAGKVVRVHVDGKTTNVAVEEKVTVAQVAGTVNIHNSVSGGSQVSGAVYITDITPVDGSGNVGEKVYTDGGGSLVSCSSTDTDVVVHILAMSGVSSLKPAITVNGVAVSLSASSSLGFWEGTAQVPVVEGKISAEHADGATWEVDVALDEPPQIQSATFTGSYPGIQTELKENDTFGFSVTADKGFVEVEVADYGAFKSGTYPTSESTTFSGSSPVANRGTSPASHGYRVRVRSATGAYSEWFTSQDTVTLNNVYPAITVTTSYPAGQQAIKAGDVATLHMTCTNFDTFTCASTELVVPSPDVFASSKEVSLSGTTDYNIVTPNVTITAEKHSNGTSTTVSRNVKIVNVPASFTITVPGRLRSGGTFGTSTQVHSVTVTSNQPLLAAPSFTAPSGTLTGSFTGSGTTWLTSIHVHDSDVKGQFSWESVVGVGLSGLQASGSGSYTIGGFVRRSFTVPAWPERTASFGTRVVDTAKLRCSNLSKGLSGSYNFAYKSNTTEEANKFSILDEETWYNCDGVNASSNTTGTMVIELEELA